MKCFECNTNTTNFYVVDKGLYVCRSCKYKLKEDKMSTNQDVHIVLKGALPADGKMLKKLRLFHWICWSIDKDWPWMDSPNNIYKTRTCEKCKGRIYKSPKLAPVDIKSAAKQCGVRVKVKRFMPEEVCWPAGVAARYMTDSYDNVVASTPVVVEAIPKAVSVPSVEPVVV